MDLNGSALITEQCYAHIVVFDVTLYFKVKSETVIECKVQRGLSPFSVQEFDLNSQRLV